MEGEGSSPLTIFFSAYLMREANTDFASILHENRITNMTSGSRIIGMSTFKLLDTACRKLSN